MAERELVRCGCSTVRNDADPPLPLLLGAWIVLAGGSMQRTVYTFSELLQPEPGEDLGQLQGLAEKFEPPRACRGCGSVYMLPKPSSPQGAT